MHHNTYAGMDIYKKSIEIAIAKERRDNEVLNCWKIDSFLTKDAVLIKRPPIFPDTRVCVFPGKPPAPPGGLRWEW